MPVRKIVSGGQTGVDRAALDAAKLLKLERGGWCPNGRLAEDGCIPDDYPLRETETTDYAERTELNVRDSDGALILAVGPPSGGTAYTIACARRLRKPYCIIDLSQETAPDRAQQWLEERSITVLNVAGPRHSQSPVGYVLAYQFLLTLLAPA
jgi:Circularly permutated YpsA SLOG family